MMTKKELPTTRPDIVLRGFRQRAGMSFDSLADAANVTPDQIRAWEDGLAKVPYDAAKRLADVLDTNAIVFMRRQAFNQHIMRRYVLHFRAYIANQESKGVRVSKEEKNRVWALYLSGLGESDRSYFIADRDYDFSRL